MAKRDFSAEKASIEHLTIQRLGDSAGRITNRIFCMTTSGVYHEGFLADNNRRIARSVVASGRTRLSVYSVVRRYLASKTAATTAV